MQKKYRKCMPKGSQNDAKMDTKSIDFSYFVEKGQNALDPLFSHIIRGSGHWKCVSNRYEINIKSMPEKTIKKVWNIMRKWDQNGAQMGAEIDEKSEKGEKKGMQKMMLEFDEKKT